MVCLQLAVERKVNLQRLLFAYKVNTKIVDLPEERLGCCFFCCLVASLIHRAVLQNAVLFFFNSHGRDLASGSTKKPSKNQFFNLQET